MKSVLRDISDGAVAWFNEVYELIWEHNYVMVYMENNTIHFMHEFVYLERNVFFLI